MELFRALKSDFQSLRNGLAEDFSKFISFCKLLSTKEGRADPANSNKILYLLALFLLLVAFSFFMYVSEISIEYVLPIYIFFTDELPKYFIVLSVLSLYMLASRPEVGKGMVAVLLSVGLINFMFVHLYADSYSLETVRTKFYDDSSGEKQKPKLWTYDVHWKTG